MEQPHIQLQTLDKAFLNSILSYGVYTDRQWTLDDYNLDSKEQQQAQIDKFLKDSELNDPSKINLKKAYQIFLNLFNRETFEKVDINLPSSGFGNFGEDKKEFDFNYQLGEYEALDNLAKAGIFKSKNPDGTYTLHLAFRGTDKNARSILDYFSDAYVNMAEYYEVFKPLEKAVLAYANDPKNNISSVQVSGHSLGGAMVQAFFNSPEVMNSKLNLEGFTYGAPGAKKNIFYKLLPNLIEMAHAWDFLSSGIKCFNLIKEEKNENRIDPRITQFSHKGDLVPKLGGLFYDTLGKKIELDDYANNNFQTQNVLNEAGLNFNIRVDNQKGHGRFMVMKDMIECQKEGYFSKISTYIKNRLAFKHHDMLRYTINIEGKSKNLIFEEKLNPDTDYLERYSPNMQKFLSFRKHFSWEINSFKNIDPISVHMWNKKFKEQAMSNGGKIYKMPEEIVVRMAQAREAAFAQKLKNIAINGIS